MQSLSDILERIEVGCCLERRFVFRGFRFVPSTFSETIRHRWYLGMQILVSRVWLWFRAKSTTLFLVAKTAAVPYSWKRWPARDFSRDPYQMGVVWEHGWLRLPCPWGLGFPLNLECIWNIFPYIPIGSMGRTVFLHIFPSFYNKNQLPWTSKIDYNQYSPISQKLIFQIDFFIEKIKKSRFDFCFQNNWFLDWNLHEIF